MVWNWFAPEQAMSFPEAVSSQAMDTAFGDKDGGSWEQWDAFAFILALRHHDHCT